VGQHIDACLDGGEDPLSLAAIATGEDRDSARALIAHPLEVVRARMDFELPAGRLVFAGVEAGNPRQIVGELGSDRRINVRLWRQVRVHLLLQESGMKMAGVGDNQTDIGHVDGPGCWALDTSITYHNAGPGRSRARGAEANRMSTPSPRLRGRG